MYWPWCFGKWRWRRKCEHNSGGAGGGSNAGVGGTVWVISSPLALWTYLHCSNWGHKCGSILYPILTRFKIRVFIGGGGGGSGTCDNDLTWI